MYFENSCDKFSFEKGVYGLWKRQPVMAIQVAHYYCCRSSAGGDIAVIIYRHFPFTGGRLSAAVYMAHRHSGASGGSRIDTFKNI